MRGKGNLQRTLGIVATVLLLLAIPSGLVGYFYVSGKRNYLVEHNLRLLGAQSEQLRLRIENYGNNVLPHLVTKAAKDCSSKPACPIDSLPEQRRLRPPKTEAATQAPFFDILKEAFERAYNLRLVGAPLISPPAPKAVDTATTIILQPKLEGGTFQLAYDYQGPVGEKGYRVKFSAVASMAELVGRLDGETFDDVLIVGQQQDKDRVIFQQATSGPRLVKLGPVKDGKGKDVPFTEVMSYPGVLQLDSAGTQYKLFVQPVRLSLKGLKDDVTWSLCGLVRMDRFRSESLAISYTLLLLFVFVFILTMVSSPLLKLWSLGPSDPLGRTDVIFACIAVLIISSLLTFFLLDFYSYERLENRLDRQLEQFSNDISGRFNAELGRLLQMLDRVNKSDIPTKKEQVTPSILCVPKNCGRPAWSRDDDPYFGIVTLIHGQGKNSGKQERKWTIYPGGTAMIDVSRRAYFRNIQEGRGWTTRYGEQLFTFSIEPIFSLNTGETLAELSMPGPQAPDWVRTVTSELISLRNTVLPPGFGYAVINENGKVMFHSNLRRTLVENFVEECDNDRELRALVSTRAEGWINAPYMGRGHRLYVRPLKDLTWTLVVFRDKEIARTENLELLSASLILSIFYGLVFVLPVLLLCLRSPEWMWPGAGRMTDYRSLLAVNLGLIVLSLGEFFFVHHHHVPSLVFTVPPFALLLNCLKLKKEARSVPSKQYPLFTLVILLPILLLVLGWQDVDVAASVSKRVGLVGVALLLYGLFLYLFPPKRLSAERSRDETTMLLESRQADWLSASVAYLLVAVSLVLIISVLPTLVFFRSAHDGEMEIFVKHGQLHLAEALSERDQRVRAEYRDVKMLPSYLARRLGDRNDIYGNFFFATMLGNGVQSPAQGPCVPERHLFDQAMVTIRPLYNDVAVQTRELVHDTAGDCSFSWEPGPVQVQLVRAPGSAAQFLPMTSDVPSLKWPNTLMSWLGLVLATLLFLSGIYLLVRFVARKIFLLGQTFPPMANARVTDLGKVTENTLVLGVAYSGKSKLLRRPDFQLIDIRLIAAAGAWTDALNREVPEDKKVVAIDHLEYHMEDPECNSQKLCLLEKLLYANCTLVVASAADPMSFPIDTLTKKDTNTQEAGKKGTIAEKARNNEKLSQEKESNRHSSPYMIRWAAVWSTFARRVEAAKEVDSAAGEKTLKAVISRLELRPGVAVTLLRECKPTEPLRRIGSQIAELYPHAEFSEKQIILEVLDRARAYYSALWATCSGEEKFALFDLAQDGFVNAKSLVLRRLVGRGLIVPGPHLRLLNESFRMFVMESEPTRELAALPKEASPWAVIRGTLIAALFGVALLVFLTQPQLLNASTTFIATASASIPALLKLFDLVRGRASR